MIKISAKNKVQFFLENSMTALIKYSFILSCLLISTTLYVYPKCRNIRTVDFRSRSYPLKSIDVTGGKLKWIHISNGRGKQLYDSTSSAFFYLEVEDIAYGDLTGDGNDEAAVAAIYGSNSASFSLTDTYIFGCVAGKIKLIYILKPEHIEKDSGMDLHESVKNPVKIKNGVLYITYGTEGNRPSPEFTTTFGYKIINGKLVLYKSPLRRRNY